MPLLEIVASKKITATVTLEESTAKQVDQYAAMTKASADDVIDSALAYVFGKDTEFKKWCTDNPTFKASFPLRLKRPAPSTGTKPSTSPAR
ncbi:hypothetical protein [Granulicella tundricola]|uniref:Uncharacterized protein n=1 Tax=Granulicella tundricola (strain ATCC BAA-1859 / DSM 23138 / MP5ACTX9) TaxID=1198114 RepID=E8X7G6_GRATM|nr:hypothetical protein [Granulicella tundricola]ADW71400.1 hypothetical protein AciX9_4454 [Granulicella tundricola MP5ACTX9]